MAKLAELRKKAKSMGIAPAVILKATTAPALEKVIADHKAHDKPKAKAKAKAKGKSPVRKAAGRKATGRKNSGRKASTPAKSKGATKAKRSSNSTGNGGRNTLDKVNYSRTEGWNPREGSAPDRIIKALKRFKGDRTKAFNHLKGDVWDFVAKKKRNGEKRTKQEALDMLKWRISRTAWDFAMRTGQHEASANRVEYGTGGTGQGVFKRGKKRGAQKASKAPARKTTRKAAPKAAGRKKAAQGRRTVAKRGRPKAKARR